MFIPKTGMKIKEFSLKYAPKAVAAVSWAAW